MKNKSKILLFSLICVLGVILDQITKDAAVKALSDKGFVSVFGEFAGFELVYNPGAFLGMFGASRWVFMIPSVIAIVLLSAWLFSQKNAHPLFAVAISLFVGGGIGNMIDRVFLGKVIDFIAFRFGSFHFPNFNVADSMITIGAVIFFIYCLIPGNVIFTPDKKAASASIKNSADSPLSDKNDGTDA